jgi:DNA anti-recombination protein RmuC
MASDSARHDKKMTPLIYVIVGLAAGGVVAALLFLAFRRGSGPSELLANARTVEEEILRRLEMLDRGLRDEFSRNREEGSAAAKTQREELGKSLENVRAIVDVRLKELQQDNAKHIDKMRATVD